MKSVNLLVVDDFFPLQDINGFYSRHKFELARKVFLGVVGH